MHQAYSNELSTLAAEMPVIDQAQQLANSRVRLMLFNATLHAFPFEAR